MPRGALGLSLALFLLLAAAWRALAAALQRRAGGASIRWHFLRDPTRAGARGADVLSYLLLSGTVTTFCAALGCWGWAHDAPRIAFGDRLYAVAPSGSAQLLGSVMFAYQMWNLAVCSVIADYRLPTFIVHHALTALLAYFVLHPFLHYYALFFIGIAEVTNTPLTVLDMLKTFPSLRARAPGVYEASQLVFGASFLPIRCVWWPIVSSQFWVQLVAVLRDGTAHSVVVVGIFLAGNVFLTGLQFLWGYKIIIMARRVAARRGGGTEGREAGGPARAPHDGAVERAAGIGGGGEAPRDPRRGLNSARPRSP